MAVPKYYEFMKPLLSILSDGRVHKLQDLYAALAEHFHLTDEDRSEYIPSGRQPLYHNRIGWAKTYLNKAGLTEPTGRGLIRITDLGKSVLVDNPDQIDQKYLLKFPQFEEFVGSKIEPEQSLITTPIKETDRTPLEDLVNAYKKIYSRLQDELLQEVIQLSPDQFERLVVELVVAMGYGGTAEDAAQVVGKTGDEGIDGIINEDKLGLDIIYIQAKRWQCTVGRPEIQKFAGALQGQKAQKGIFITTSSFTKDALDYVNNIQSKIILIDGSRLAELMFDHNIGVTPVASYEIKKIDSDYFTED